MSLESQVSDLVDATTDLLAAVNVSKSTLDDSKDAAAASATLASQWATKTDGAVANGEFSAKKHAVDAGASASAAAASASAAAQSALDVGSLSGAILNVTSPNGVAYLNGSNVLTSGSALTFDGSSRFLVNGVRLDIDGGTSADQLRLGTDPNYYKIGRNSASGPLEFYGTQSGVVSYVFGGVNGEQMRLTSTGLGIGTSSPGAKLHVYDTSNAKVLSQTTTGYAQLQTASTSGDFHFAIDNSTGTGFGSGAYSRVLYSTGAYPMVFSTNSTERMILDASGNLGLGVTPSAWGTTFKALQVGGGGGTVSGSGTQVNFSNNWVSTATGDKYIATGYATVYTQVSGQHQWYTAPSGTAGDAISFTQAMTLDASGNLLIGQNTSGSVNANSWSFTQSSLGQLVGNHDSSAISGAYYIGFYHNASGIGSITQNGTTAVAYNTTSDHRLKTNVRPADALRFMDIEFVDFEWVDGRHDCGVIAHQLASIYPDLVLGEKDATEVRTVEITPAVPAVTERRLVTPAVEAVPAVLDEQGNEVTPAVPAQEAVYETVEISPAVPAVTEEQSFPVYQQVNYMGLIGRMGTKVQQLQRALDALEARLAALEAA